MKMKLRNLFDRIGLYRWAAVLLTVVFIRSIVQRVSQTHNLPVTGWVILFWLGWFALMIGGVRDLVHEVKARRAVGRMINKRTSERV